MNSLHSDSCLLFLNNTCDITNRNVTVFPQRISLYHRMFVWDCSSSCRKTTDDIHIAIIPFLCTYWRCSNQRMKKNVIAFALLSRLEQRAKVALMPLHRKGMIGDQESQLKRTVVPSTTLVSSSQNFRELYATPKSDGDGDVLHTW